MGLREPLGINFIAVPSSPGKSLFIDLQSLDIRIEGMLFFSECLKCQRDCILSIEECAIVSISWLFDLLLYSGV